MQNFQDYLVEDRNTHLEHLEDEIINNGTKGAKTAINFLKSIKQMLQGGSGGSTVSVKWDGAPAVFCGINPENGKFFVATKSLFNKSPKINYTNADISRNHGGALADKLKDCLKYLPSLGISGILQGDLLFTSGDKKTANVAGQRSIVFTPNTITYAVPEDSDIGKQIDYAKVGIIFHTTYKGETLADMTASAGADVEAFGTSPDVFFDNATYKDVSGSAKFTKQETVKFMNGVEKLETLLQNVPRDLSSMLGNNKDFVPYFQMYINAMVKEGKLPNNVNQFLQGFKDFYVNKMQQQIAGLKAQKALAVRQDKMKQMPAFMNKIKKPLQAMLTFYKAVQTMKGFVLKKMNQAMAIGSFSQTDNGLEVTEPEGFVAVDKSGGAVKLVDRLGFSRRNLTAVSKFKKY